jgi:hypothetical protein
MGESNELYLDYCKIINSILNINGKYFVTCLHRNIDFKFSLEDKLKCYILWSGNDGFYPHTKTGFTKYAEKAGLKNIYQEDRTIDYWITSVIYMSYFRCRNDNIHLNSINIQDILIALFKTIAGPYYIHSYLCFTPTNNYYWSPWLWQFVPQERNGKLEFPGTLEYILFEKDSN